MDIEAFFTKDFLGEPFVIFSPSHLAAIGVIVLVNLFLVYLRSHSDAEWRAKMSKRIRYTFAIVLIVNELAWHVWNYAVGQWTIQTMLPLHVCSVLVWLSAYMLLARNYRFYEFAYFMGIAGALQAILTPDLGIYGYPHFRFFQTFISHGLIVTVAIYMTIIDGFRPTWASLGRVLIGMNVYAAVVGFINYMIGSNYLFIAHKPETPSLLDMLGPWPWYILAMEAIGLICFLILYLPFALRDGSAHRRLARNPV